MAPADAVRCALVAPCRHSAGATSVLAFPPATLTAAAILPAPAGREDALRPDAAAETPRSGLVSTPPPRSPAA